MSPELLDALGRLWERLGPAGIALGIAIFALWILNRQSNQHIDASRSIVEGLQTLSARVDKHDEKEEERHRETLRAFHDRNGRHLA